MKRGQSGLSGILAVDKPAGMTSHDVVDRVRRMTGERRVGHAGTLDPMATGLMFVCVGAATRLSQYLMGHDKSYCARIVFGLQTDTDDKEGRVLNGRDAQGALEAVEGIAALDAAQVVAGMVGNQMQLPPAYSAIKKNGVVAYKAARESTELELEARPVTVHEAQFLACGTEAVCVADGQGGTVEATLPYWDVAFTVSKGTYIRALARDLGIRLGCGAHLGALRRTSVAGVSVASARTLDEWAQAFEQHEPIPWLDPVQALGLERVELDAQQAKDVSNGRKMGRQGVSDLICCVREGKLFALYENAGDICKPAVVLPGGVAGAR